MNREYLETLLKDFGQMLTTETVIGEPLTFGKVTVVPVVSVSFGFGTGSGGNNPETSDKKVVGSASSAGARLVPVAFLSIHEDGTVNLHHVKSKELGSSPVDRLLEMAPSFIDKLSASLGRGKGKKETPDVSEAFGDLGSSAVTVPGDIDPVSDWSAENARKAMAATAEEASREHERKRAEAVDDDTRPEADGVIA